MFGKSVNLKTPIDKVDVDSRPQRESSDALHPSSNAQLDAETAYNQLPCASQCSSLTMVTDTHHTCDITLVRQPQSHMMDLNPPQSIDSPHQLQGYYHPTPNTPRSVYPTDDLHIHTRDTMTYPPHPVHHLTLDNVMGATRPEDFYQEPGGSARLRYHVVLRAPTAMASKPIEPPVTYLNKGQRYHLTITDTKPLLLPPSPVHVRYRTYIRISFHRDDQRSNANAYWQLWKAGRGLSEEGQVVGEEHAGSGTLHAIEYLDKLGAGTIVNDHMSDREVQLETSSFDGFCILWSPKQSKISTSQSALTPPECTITVRFNFLTTDFSHYKGVKGFPVRLCAKTEMVADHLGRPPPELISKEGGAEVCYCKVNLFRMYGAERKLSTDAARVRKALEKVRREIQKRQSDPGSYLNQNSKGLGPSSKAPGKCSTMKYTHQMRVFEGFQKKLASLQEMLMSARPVTILSLPGDPSDVPDLPPSNQSAQHEYVEISDADRLSNTSCKDFQDETSSSSLLMGSPWEAGLLLDLEDPSSSDDRHESPSYQVARIPKDFFEDVNVRRRYIEVLDIDPSYKPPTQQQRKPVACFYIGFAGIDQQRVDYYNAVYLTEWTAQDLIEQISKKLGIAPHRVMRVLLVRGNSIEFLDDNVIHGIADGQEMLAEVSESWKFDHTSDRSGRQNSIEIKLRY
ncbi:CP2 transcription factor-domain-containing protein [Aspergillus granulosus]|uniref:CP2 transcription factor-domain-containing protein n=1 Tax=Aspergillus granulosus TaxID=176169 RepID=A0ABR4HEC4_9EURO